MFPRVHRITALSQEQFNAKARNAKLILLYPWAPHRNAFIPYILADDSRTLIYTRVNEGTNTLVDFLGAVQAQWNTELGGFGSNLSNALGQQDASAWAEAFATDLKQLSDRLGRQICAYLDECDRIPHDDNFATFFSQLLENLDSRVQLAVSSRLLKYQPWFGFVERGDAVVFGTERRENDVMYTVIDEPKPALEVYAFGRGYALVNGQEIVNWDGALPRHLFFFFMDNPLVTRDEIFQMFWPRLSTKEATNVFHVTKRKISERISNKVEDGANYEMTSYNAGFYRPSDKLVRYYDVQEFETAISGALAALEEKEEEELYLRAVDLYKSPFLQDSPMAWMETRRNELRGLYAQALIGLGRLAKQREDIENALGYFIRSLKETPEREDIHRDIMTLYLNAGRIEEAKEQYAVLVEHLEKQFGIAPSLDTRQLYDVIIAKR